MEFLNFCISSEVENNPKVAEKPEMNYGILLLNQQVLNRAMFVRLWNKGNFPV
jgi:hypothetical protein